MISWFSLITQPPPTRCHPHHPPRVPPGVPMPGWSLGLTKMMVPGPGATEWRRRCWRWSIYCVERFLVLRFKRLKLRRLKYNRKISIIYIIMHQMYQFDQLERNIIEYHEPYAFVFVANVIIRSFQNIPKHPMTGISWHISPSSQRSPERQILPIEPMKRSCSLSHLGRLDLKIGQQPNR